MSPEPQLTSLSRRGGHGQVVGTNLPLRRARLYGVVSLAGLGIGLLVLSLLLWKARRLPSWGLSACAYEALLLGLGASAAAFLFGALRCWARSHGRNGWGVLHVIASVVGGALMTGAGFHWVPNPWPFDVMVFIHVEGGVGDRIPEGSGEVAMALGPEVRRQPIGPHGTASFQGIASRHRGEAVPVWVESTRFESVNPAQTHPLNHAPIELVVRKKAGQLSGGDQNQPEWAARQKLDELLQIRRQLAQGHPELFLPEVARTLSQLATLDRSRNRLQEARQGFEEALQIFLQLAQTDSDAYLPEVVRTLNCLGTLYCDDKRLELARQEFEKALQLGRSLALQNAEACPPDLANTLSNLGMLAILARPSNQLEAREALEEALRIYRGLAREAPAVYLPRLAMTLYGLGKLDAVQQQTEAARKEYGEALQICRGLLQTDESQRAGVAMTLYELGQLDAAQHRTDQAREELGEALQISETPATRNPGQFSPFIAQVKQRLEQLPK